MPATKNSAVTGRLAAVAVIAAAAVAGRPVPALAHEAPADRLHALDHDVEHRPDDAPLRLRRARLRRETGRFDDALADLARAAALDPALRDECARRAAGTLLDAGRAAAAVHAARVLRARHPDDRIAWLVEARGLRRLGRPLAAADAYDRALAGVADARPQVILERADALAAAGDAHLDRALRGLDAALAEAGPVIALELRALELERRLGRHDDALARVDRLLVRARRPERWLALRGAIHADRGARVEAARDYHAAAGAIAALPPRHRATPAVRDLSNEVGAALRALETPPAGESP